MIGALKNLFRARVAEGEVPAAKQLHIAVSALLCECIRMDTHDRPEQRAAAVSALCGLFGFATDESNMMLDEGRARAKQLTSYFRPVSIIKREFTLEQRVQLVEYLWRVAFANGQLDQYEDHYVRKIANLLYVTNTQCMVARGRARPT